MSNIEERLNELDSALEQLRMPLTNYLLRVETDLSHRIKETDSARARGDNMMHDLVTRTANAIYKELKALEDQYASTSRVERISEELAELRRELNIALANGREETQRVNDRLDKLEDAVNWTDGANMENGHAPNYPANDPEPVEIIDPAIWHARDKWTDTTWHPYDPLSTGEAGYHPIASTRVITLARGFNVITGPWVAGQLNWGEAGDATIVAWRYAKEGE